MKEMFDNTLKEVSPAEDTHPDEDTRVLPTDPPKPELTTTKVVRLLELLLDKGFLPKALP